MLLKRNKLIRLPLKPDLNEIKNTPHVEYNTSKNAKSEPLKDSLNFPRVKLLNLTKSFPKHSLSNLYSNSNHSGKQISNTGPLFKLTDRPLNLKTATNLDDALSPVFPDVILDNILSPYDTAIRDLAIRGNELADKIYTYCVSALATIGGSENKKLFNEFSQK